MKTVDDRADYNRNVLAHLAFLETEDDTLLRDLQGDSFDAQMRRAAVDGVISQMWDQNLMDFCSAMRIAGVAAQQAAHVMKAFNVMQERRKP